MFSLPEKTKITSIIQENKLRIELTTPINLIWTAVAQTGSKGKICVCEMWSGFTGNWTNQKDKLSWKHRITSITHNWIDWKSKEFPIPTTTDNNKIVNNDKITWKLSPLVKREWNHGQRSLKNIKGRWVMAAEAVGRGLRADRRGFVNWKKEKREIWKEVDENWRGSGENRK